MVFTGTHLPTMPIRRGYMTLDYVSHLGLRLALKDKNKTG